MMYNDIGPIQRVCYQQTTLLKEVAMQALLFSPYPEEANVFQVILQQAGFIVRASRSLDQAIETWPENPADLVFIAVTENPERALKPVLSRWGYAAGAVW